MIQVCWNSPPDSLNGGAYNVQQQLVIPRGRRPCGVACAAPEPTRSGSPAQDAAATLQARTRVESLAAEPLGSVNKGRKLKREELAELVLQWKASPTKRRRKIHPEGMNRVNSDTLGLARDLVSKDWAITGLVAKYPKLRQTPDDLPASNVAIRQERL